MAEAFDAEIINFDSLLFYRELQIGVAKPTIQERARVPHHLIDVASIDQPWDASIFRQACLNLLTTTQKTRFLLVGGSGFYLRALTEGMYPSTSVPTEIRQQSTELYQSSGIDPFWKLLSEVDPETYSLLKPNDHYRIMRAIEHWWTHHTPFSLSQKQWKADHEKNRWTSQLPLEETHLYLDLPKEEHWNIIQQRTKSMLDSGLRTEVESLLQTYRGDERPLQSIGYKEVVAYLKSNKNEREDEASLIEPISIATRQLAKAQRTWFQKIPKKSFHPLVDSDKIKVYLDQFFNHGPKEESL